jgi:hypothetical protein
LTGTKTFISVLPILRSGRAFAAPVWASHGGFPRFSQVQYGKRGCRSGSNRGVNARGADMVSGVGDFRVVPRLR